MSKYFNVPMTPFQIENEQLIIPTPFTWQAAPVEVVEAPTNALRAGVQRIFFQDDPVPNEPFTQDQLQDMSIFKMKPGQWFKVNKMFTSYTDAGEPYIALDTTSKYRFKSYSYNWGKLSIEVEDNRGNIYFAPEKDITVMKEIECRLPNFL